MEKARQSKAPHSLLGRDAQFAWSLMELLVVIAILATLMMTAIPNYAQFMVRSKIVNVMQGIRPYQLAMVEQFMLEGEWPSENQLGVHLNSEIVNQHSILKSADIVGGKAHQVGIELSFDSPHFSVPITILLKPILKHQHVSWRCQLIDGAEEDLLKRYLPTECG